MWINDTKFAEAPAFLVEDVSASSLDIPGDIADTPEVEGGREGDAIRFQIMGFDADRSRVCQSGTYTNST